MAERAIKKVDFAHSISLNVALSNTVTYGKPVKFGSVDNEVVDAGAASDLWIGFPNETVTSSASQTQRVTVWLPGPVVPVVVGTGGATRGKRGKVVADGVTDAATLGGGTVAQPSVGFFMQSGVAGDVVGLCMCADSRVTA